MSLVVSLERSLFEQAAELYARDPNAVMVGSVGRAAVMGTHVEPYRSSGVPRDIDVIRFGERTRPKFGKDERLDYVFEDWIAADGSYLVFPHNPNLYVPVPHPEIFEVVARNVNGWQLATPHHDVLGRIGTMQFIQRPKDKKAAMQYEHYLQAREDHLPEELLQPFDQFRNMLSQLYGYRTRGLLRNGYHRVASEAIRQQIQLGERLNWLRSR